MNRFRPLTAPTLTGEPPAQDPLGQQALLLELTPVVVCDPQDQILYWNRAAEVMYGFTREQALGRVSHELLHTEFPEPPERILARLRSGRQWQGELGQVRSDGARISVSSEWIGYFEPNGELGAVIKVNHESTERKRAEQALADSTAQFNGIIASAMDAIISTDAEQRVVLFNPAAERMFGVSSAEALGQKIERFIPERFRPAHAQHVEHFGQTGVTTRRMGALGTISGVRASGQEFPIEASISQVQVGGEKLFTVILRDITRRRQAEAGLLQAQAELRAHAEELEKRVARRTAQLRETIAELEAFSYSLSHDMRAPLRAIHTFTHIALEEHRPALGPEGADLLGRVLVAAERMDRLMRDVLAFSRVSRQEIQFETVDLEKVLREVIAERTELQPPKAELKLETPMPRVVANPACLTQTLSNLLSNAVKFVAPGVLPQVRVWTELLAVQSPMSKAQSPAAEASRQPLAAPIVRLWVEDNGIGIEPEAHHKIFEIFQRLSSQYEGTGIGLAIVRKAVERMRGAVGVESEPGKGSKFWIELPAVP